MQARTHAREEHAAVMSPWQKRLNAVDVSLFSDGADFLLELLVHDGIRLGFQAVNPKRPGADPHNCLLRPRKPEG